MPICDQRSVIITGAGGGLGRAYALAFAAEGARVVVNDIRLEAAQAVVSEVQAAGGEAMANSGDITTMAGAQSIVDAAVAAYGEVHVLVNNAGILRDRMFISLSEDDWDQVMRVHLKGHFCLANILGRRWRDAAKAGNKIEARIINNSLRAGPARLHRAVQLFGGQRRYCRLDFGAGRRDGAIRHHGQCIGPGRTHLHDRKRHARRGQGTSRWQL